MDSKKKDTIYSRPMEHVKDFEFNEQVAQVFDDMLNRSIPGYQTIIRMIAVLAAQYAKKDSRVYDLGCSHGVLTALLKTRIKQDGCSIIAVDNSAPLIEQCRSYLSSIEQGIPVECLCSDVCDVNFLNASVVVMNFILQFVGPERKRPLLEKIFNGLNDGGILILSEKIYFEDEKENDFQMREHHAYKASEGYSAIEIQQKQKAIQNILKMETVPEHIRQLREIGFGQVYLWYQCFNFVSFVAVKS